MAFFAKLVWDLLPHPTPPPARVQGLCVERFWKVTPAIWGWHLEGAEGLQCSGLGVGRGLPLQRCTQEALMWVRGPWGPFLQQKRLDRRAGERSGGGPEGDPEGYVRQKRGSETCTVRSPTWHYSWASFLPSAPEDGVKRREETGCSKKLRWLSSGDQLSSSPRPLGS